MSGSDYLGNYERQLGATPEEEERVVLAVEAREIAGKLDAVARGLRFDNTALADRHAWAVERAAELVDALLAERADREELIRDCLAYFRQFDRERTDGRTSPIVPRLEAALDDP